MKKIVLTLLSLIVVLFSFAQKISDLREAIDSKKYSEAKNLIEILIKKPKFKDTLEVYFLKGKLYSEIFADSAASQTHPDAFSISMSSFMKVAEIDTTQFLVYCDLDKYKSLNSLYGNSYNRGFKLLQKNDFEKSLLDFQKAETSGKFIIKYLKETPQEYSALNFYIGLAAIRGGKEELGVGYFIQLSKENISGTGNEEVYRSLMRYYFSKNNAVEFENIRKQGLSLYPNEEYFTYNEVVFINDMEDVAEKLKRIEAKVIAEPKNTDALYLYSEILFDKLNEDSAYVTEEEYTAAETKLAKIYESIDVLLPTDGIIYNAGIIYINKAFKINSKISNIREKIAKFNNAQKKDKNGNIPKPPKELTNELDLLKTKLQAAYDLSLPYILKAQPIWEEKSKTSKKNMQIYKKLIDNLIEIYNSKRQAAQASKVTADEKKFELEENRWIKEYDRIDKLLNPAK